MLKNTGGQDTQSVVKIGLDILMTAGTVALFSWSGIKTEKPAFRELEVCKVMIGMYN